MRGALRLVSVISALVSPSARAQLYLSTLTGFGANYYQTQPIVSDVAAGVAHWALNDGIIRQILTGCPNPILDFFIIQFSSRTRRIVFLKAPIGIERQAFAWCILRCHNNRRGNGRQQNTGCQSAIAI